MPLLVQGFFTRSLPFRADAHEFGAAPWSAVAAATAFCPRPIRQGGRAGQPLASPPCDRSGDEGLPRRERKEVTAAVFFLPPLHDCRMNRRRKSRGNHWPHFLAIVAETKDYRGVSGKRSRRLSFSFPALHDCRMNRRRKAVAAAAALQGTFGTGTFTTAIGKADGLSAVTGP
jgi:hypothetical protein